MSRSPMSYRLAGTLSLAALVMSLASAPWQPASGAEKPAKSDASREGEGLIRLRREAPTINLESILDSNQPDFFLDVTIGSQSIIAPLPLATPLPSPTPSPTPSPEPSVSPVPTPSPVPSTIPAPIPVPDATPSAVPTAPATMSALSAPLPSPSIPLPTPQPKPLKSAVQLMYQAQKLAQLGQYRVALNTVEEAIAQEPETASLQALKGSILFKLHDYNEAESAWMKALELDPSAYDVKASLSWLRKRSAEEHQ